MLPGYDEGPAEGVQGDIEASVLEEQELSLEDFHVLELPKLSADGTRRPMWCPLDACRVEAGTDDHGEHVTVSFTLPKGSYATCVLREFMKTSLEAYQ